MTAKPSNILGEKYSFQVSSYILQNCSHLMLLISIWCSDGTQLEKTKSHPAPNFKSLVFNSGEENSLAGYGCHHCSSSMVDFYSIYPREIAQAFNGIMYFFGPLGLDLNEVNLNLYCEIRLRDVSDNPSQMIFEWPSPDFSGHPVRAG